MKNMTDMNSNGPGDTSMGTGSINYEKSAYKAPGVSTSPKQDGDTGMGITKDKGNDTLETYNSTSICK